MSKFTPGPWKIGFPPPNGEQTIGTLNGLMVAVVTTGATGIHTIANARLIAAAPDLYDLLAECAEYMDYIPESAAGGDDVARAIVQRAKKILAKVEAE